MGSAHSRGFREHVALPAPLLHRHQDRQPRGGGEGVLSWHLPAGTLTCSLRPHRSDFLLCTRCPPQAFSWGSQSGRRWLVCTFLEGGREGEGRGCVGLRTAFCILNKDLDFLLVYCPSILSHNNKKEVHPNFRNDLVVQLFSSVSKMQKHDFQCYFTQG